MDAEQVIQECVLSEEDEMDLVLTQLSKGKYVRIN